MIFTRLPAQFSSACGELSYAFSDAAGKEIYIEIRDARDDRILGVKRFCDTTSGTLNIAPIVRRSIRFRPSTGPSGFSDPENRTASVRLSSGAARSEPRTLVAARGDILPPRILTTMPLQRIVAYGESDEITCCIPDAHTVSLRSDVSAAPIEYTSVGGNELTVFRFDTRSFLPAAKTVSLSITSGERTIAVIDYTIVPAVERGCRIAWRSGAGSIEHYTFPVVKNVVQKTEKDSVLSETDGFVSPRIRTERLTTLLSAYETAAVTEALSEIVSSPQVWRIDGDRYREIDVLPAEIPLRRHGSLGCIEISFRDRRERSEP